MISLSSSTVSLVMQHTYMHQYPMQHSKSLASFVPSTVNTDVTLETRARRRSSLDTFVIPRRTRIPSSKPQPIDFQIARGLLSPRVFLEPPPRRSATMRNGRGPGTAKHRKPPAPRAMSAAYESIPQPPPFKVRPEISRRPPPQMNGREIRIVPHCQAYTEAREHQRDGSDPLPPIAPQRKPPSPPFQQNTGTTQDGANDSAHDLPKNLRPTDSRVTSMSWSTVSHRIFTDSSGSSRGMGSSHFLEEFNKLAVKHGISELAEAPNGK